MIVTRGYGDVYQRIVTRGYAPFGIMDETGLLTTILMAMSASDLQTMIESRTLIPLSVVTGHDEYFPFYSGEGDECAEWDGHGWGWRQA